MTIEETWVHHFQPETTQQSKQWKHLCFLHSKEAKTVMSAGKVNASIFWVAEGILLVDYLDKGHTFTGAYYADLLRQLWEKINKISAVNTRSALPPGQCSSHTYTVTMATIPKCGFQLVKDPLYSPDLAAFDYYLC